MAGELLRPVTAQKCQQPLGLAHGHPPALGRRLGLLVAAPLFRLKGLVDPTPFMCGVRVQPPLVISEAALDEAVRILDEALASVAG